jgi:hypothetical protein
MPTDPSIIYHLGSVWSVGWHGMERSGSIFEAVWLEHERMERRFQMRNILYRFGMSSSREIDRTSSFRFYAVSLRLSRSLCCPWLHRWSFDSLGPGLRFDGQCFASAAASKGLAAWPQAAAHARGRSKASKQARGAGRQAGAARAAAGAWGPP